MKNNGEDELLGFWENGADDLSGLHAIWGYGVEFLKDGEGFRHDWGGDEPGHQKARLQWVRNGEKKISVKFAGDQDWNIVEYEIDFFEFGGIASHSLIEKNDTKFWSSPEPLYRYIGPTANAKQKLLTNSSMQKIGPTTNAEPKPLVRSNVQKSRFYHEIIDFFKAVEAYFSSVFKIK